MMRLLARRVPPQHAVQLVALSIPKQPAKCKNKDSNDLVVITFVIRCAHSDSVMIARIDQAERLANFQARVGSLFVPS